MEKEEEKKKNFPFVFCRKETLAFFPQHLTFFFPFLRFAALFFSLFCLSPPAPTKKEKHAIEAVSLFSGIVLHCIRSCCPLSL